MDKLQNGSKMWERYLIPTSLDDALEILKDHQHEARILAGGTDVMREIDAGHCDPRIILDISQIGGRDDIVLENDGLVRIGMNVTHNQFISESRSRNFVVPLAQSCLQIGSPQIRNCGTIAGNIMTASPAADTVPSLIVLDAEVVLCSHERGERVVPVDKFIAGPKKVIAEPDEILTEIRVKSLKENERGCFIKLADRQAMGISIVNIAVRITFDEGHMVRDAVIALGSVAPKVVRASKAESFLIEKELNDDVIALVAQFATREIKPISDIRGSAKYRQMMSEVLTKQALSKVRDRKEMDEWPKDIPSLSLDTDKHVYEPRFAYDGSQPLKCVVNGKDYSLENVRGKSLLQVLRDDLGLTGTKLGCREGICGACTVLLDGKAVMSCLIPAPRAHNQEILTVEGLSANSKLSNIQKAFVEEGAVQCGYCTPGFLMSAYAYIHSSSSASPEAVANALAGNLCRCTGYKKIVTAVEKAFYLEQVG